MHLQTLRQGVCKDVLTVCVVRKGGRERRGGILCGRRRGLQDIGLCWSAHLLHFVCLVTVLLLLPASRAFLSITPSPLAGEAGLGQLVAAVV